MNLLPVTSNEFATKEYWNKFFEKRGKLSFDWYGEVNSNILYLTLIIILKN